jgi:prepilin-type N-terminal cleavage/methylation domain-containing protein
MRKAQQGFTLVELMIVIVILGILAAIAIPNFVTMQGRAKEGSIKANMHTWQLSAEDYGIQNDATYAAAAGSIEPLLPGAGANFKNPFNQTTGNGSSWEDRSSVSAAPGAVPGIVSYADSGSSMYNIKGYGRNSALPLVLTGQ